MKRERLWVCVWERKSEWRRERETERESKWRRDRESVRVWERESERTRKRECVCGRDRD